MVVSASAVVLTVKATPVVALNVPAEPVNASAEDPPSNGKNGTDPAPAAVYLAKRTARDFRFFPGL